MAKTTYETERETIYSYFFSNFNMLPIIWQNQENTLINEEEFVRISIINGDNLQKSIGTTKLYRSLSNLIIEIFVKKNTGVSKANEICQEIDGLFKSKKFDAEQIQFRSPNKIVIGNMDNYYKVNMICSFYRNSVE